MKIICKGAIYQYLMHNGKPIVEDIYRKQKRFRGQQKYEW